MLEKEGIVMPSLIKKYYRNGWPCMSEEYCNNCDELFYVISNKIQPCPECGEPLKPCNACPVNLEGNCGVSKCPFDNPEGIYEEVA